jgi:hypothetical protein
MARMLQRSTASSFSNPVLDVWTLIANTAIDASSALMIGDPFALGFQIWDLSTVTSPTQVFPTTPGQFQAVDLVTPGVNRLGVGHFVANWTPGSTENLGLHQVVWQMTPTNGATPQTFRTDFDIITAGVPVKGPMYARLSQLRDEGFTVSQLSDVRAVQLIGRASKMVDRITRRFFEPRYRTYNLDGEAGPSQKIGDPIIALDSAYIDNDLVDPTTYRVFNRHITDGLTNPDDRADPRLQFNRITRTLSRIDVFDRPFANREIFWPGPKNVQVNGLFGYTDPDPDIQVGVTPDAINLVTMMIVARETALIGNPDDRKDAHAPDAQQLRTRDQTIVFSPSRNNLIPSGAVGEFTGDPEIDDILARYMAPPFIGAC